MNDNHTSGSNRLPYPAAAAVFLLCAAIGALATACCARLDGTDGGVYSLLSGVVLSAAMLLAVRRCGGPDFAPRGTYFSRYLPLVLLFPAIFLVLRPGMLSGLPPTGELLLWSLSLLAEVLWEELLFRQGALLLFGRRELFQPRTVLFTNLVFGAYCLFRGICFTPVGSGPAAQIAAAVCMGVFFTALLLRTKNVFVPATAAFLTRFTAGLPSHGAVGGQEEDLLSALFLCALAVVVGGTLILRGRRAERRNGQAQ